MKSIKKRKTDKDYEKKTKLVKNGKRANTGITLIALVVTIIVLLILAAVSIATLTGQNRNINKSRRKQN